MATVNILESVPRSQPVSPFFNRLPFDIRLMIYLLLFTGGRVSVWFDGEFTKTKLGKWPWQHMFHREGQCCFRHWRSNFSLLMTCRKLFMEAFPTYWSSTIIPAPIKANLCHLRNVRLPVIGFARPACDASNWAPTLLRDFPKLKTCALPHTGLRRLAAAAGGIVTPDVLRVTGGLFELGVDYFDVGPFRVKTGESPAVFLERTTGIQRSSGIIILSLSEGCLPYDNLTHWNRSGKGFKYFNWATGMVYQTTAGGGDDEPRWDEAIRAVEGSSWCRCYCVRQ